MNRICLLVETPPHDAAKALAFDGGVLPLKVVAPEDVSVLLETGQVAAMVVFVSDGINVDVTLDLVNQFWRKVGPLPEALAIVCAKSDLRLANQAFDWGMENVWLTAEWAESFRFFYQKLAARLADPAGPDSQVMNLARAIFKSDKDEEDKAEKSLHTTAAFHLQASYSLGMAFYVTGRFKEAVPFFKRATELNRYFRPAWSSWAELCLVLGDFAVARRVWEQLENLNNDSPEHKANLAIACFEEENFQQGADYLSQAEIISAAHPKILEAKAVMAIKQGDMGGAIKIIEIMKDASPYFAAKLNDLGILLSKNGKGDSALTLYRKAHRVVRNEMRYKISLNAALACYRLQRFEEALRFLSRCETEYGAAVDKVEKVREACRQQQKAG